MRKAEDARLRFARAAMELIRSSGYAETTVPRIAAAAGLTERTFYRYFTDKTEVLFARSQEFETEIVAAFRAARGGRPLDRIAAALVPAGQFLEENRADVIARQAIVASHAALQERELAKMASLTGAIEAVLADEGLSKLQSRLIAEAAVIVWRVAIDLWCGAEPAPAFAQCVEMCLQDLSAVMAV